MSKGVSGKCFFILLVDVDSYDDVKAYLKGKSFFFLGKGLYHETIEGKKEIYFLVEYSRPVQLDIEKMPYCRVKIAKKALKRRFECLEMQSEEVWVEGSMREQKKTKQTTLDAFIKSKKNK